MRIFAGKAGAVFGAVLGVAGLFAMSGEANAQFKVVVTNYGVSANGMPFAIAVERNLFDAEGIKVSEIITSAGGGTTLRNMMAANAPYAEINPAAAIGAIQEGLDLKIIAENVQTVAEFTWFVKSNSPIRTPADLKGAKIGFNNPRATSVALLGLLLESVGMTMKDINMVRTGGFGESLTALEVGTIDMTPMTEPLWSQYAGKYHALAKASDVLPPLSNVVAVALSSMSESQKKFTEAVIRARRNAVKFMEANPEEAGDIVAKHYNIDRNVARATVKNLITSRTNGIPYWGEGRIHLAGLDRMVKAQQSVGAIAGNVDLKAIIDTQYLPADLRAMN